MKILVISENIPKPDFSSGDRRFMGILQILAKNHDVVFCIPNDQPWLKPEENSSYIEQIEHKGITFLPFNMGLFEKTITEDRYDIGFFEFYWIAERYMDHFSARQPGAVVIVDSVDLHFAREETQYKLGLLSRKKVQITRTRELTVYGLADISVAVSDEDYDRLAVREKTGHVALIPNVVPKVTRILKERRPSLLFIGCYAWPPNVDAMIWFVHDVWPLIRQSRGDVQLQIVGSRPPDEITAMAEIEGVHVYGYVPDTAPYLDEAMISIAPLRYGGGMKGKVNEAMAHGLPVVSTSIGAQGFKATHGKEMFIADTPEEFAHAVLTLLNDPGLQHFMGEAGQVLNESICSPEVIEQQINGMISLSDHLLKHPAKRGKRWKTWKLRFNRFCLAHYWHRFA